MRDAMLELGLPAPQFSQVEVGGAKVRVVLRNNFAGRKPWVDSDIAHLIGARIAAALGDKQKDILNYLAIHKKINISDAVQLTRHSWRKSKDILEELTLMGVLKYVKRKDVAKDVKAYYRLADDEE